MKYRITAGSGAADPDGLEAREIYVELAGPDAELVTERGGEVLRALEHVAAKIIRLEPEEHDKVSFDANQFQGLACSRTQVDRRDRSRERSSNGRTL